MVWVLVFVVGAVAGGLLSVIHRTVGFILLAAIITGVVAAGRSQILLAPLASALTTRRASPTS